MRLRFTLWLNSSSNALRVALVLLTMAQLLSFPHIVHSQTAHSVFCDTFAVPFGYKCLEYTTMTTDGYLLVAHRLSNQPRTTSQPSSDSTTEEAAPAPLSPLCVSTVDQPFETIHDFVSDSDVKTHQPSKSTGVRCFPVAPVPRSGSDSLDGNNSEIIESDMTIAEQLDTLKASQAVASQTVGHSEAQGEGIINDLEVLRKNNRERLDTVNQLRKNNRERLDALNQQSSSANRPRADHNRNLTALDSSNATAAASITATNSKTTGRSQHRRGSNHPAVDWTSKPKFVQSTIGDRRQLSMDLESDPHKSSAQSKTKPGTPWKSSAPSTRTRVQRHHGHHRTHGSVATAEAGNLTTKLSASPTERTSESEAVPLAPEGGQPVLLMHQEFENGNSWFVDTDADSDQLLPFLLLNSGFDVWIGHQRATYYAHGHATLTHDNESYWDWTWDEHAKYDMPALLELVYTESGSTVHLVGISQSATAGAAAATMPLPSSLLRSLTLIGPTIYRGNTTSRTLTAWASLLPSNTDRNYFDRPLPNGVFNLTTDLFTNTIISSMNPMAATVADISGPNCCLGSYVLKFDNGWDGTTSRRNMLHYQQGIRTNTWSHFDYGSFENNSIAYDGMPLPPSYSPEDIPATLPMLVIYGGQDNTAPARGCRNFLSRLRSPSNIISAVFLPAYAHFDLMYSLNRTEDVFIPVLQFLEKQRALH